MAKVFCSKQKLEKGGEGEIPTSRVIAMTGNQKSPNQYAKDIPRDRLRGVRKTA
jgi:hypothetical protein